MGRKNSKNGDHPNREIFHSYHKALIVAEHLGPEFLKNPIRDVPALLQTPQGSVFESNGIAHYVAHRSFLLGDSKLEYGQIQQWIDFSSFELDANIRGWIMPRLGYATYIKHLEESYIDGLKRGLDALNKYLASHTLLVGDRMTLADIITTCNLLLAFKLLTPKSFTSEYPHVERYFWTMVNQPEFSKIMGEVKQTEAVLPLPSAKKPEAKPPSKMVLDDWKRLYSNTESNFREVATKGMAPTFYVGSVAGLKKLDEYLLSRSYIAGYRASKDDLKVRAAFTNAPSAEYVNLSRWFNHVGELSHISGRMGLEEEEGVGVTVEGSASFPEEAIATPPVADTKAAADEDDDSDVDLFGEETEEEKKAAEDRSAAVKASIKKKGRSRKKKSIKKKESGKSLVMMDIKPWDDETDMKKLDEAVRSVKMESLLWGSSMCKVGGLFLNFIFMIAAKLMPGPALRRRKVSR